MHKYQDPDCFQQARLTLGLTAADMAEALGVRDGRTIRKWESGESAIPGPAARLVEIWLENERYRPDRSKHRPYVTVKKC